VEATLGLAEATSGLVEAMLGLMEAMLGLAESADLPVLAVPVSSVAGVGTEMRHRARDRVDSAPTPDRSPRDPRV